MTFWMQEGGVGHRMATKASVEEKKEKEEQEEEEKKEEEERCLVEAAC